MILLDTHVLVWLVTQDGRLSRPAASAIRRARSSDGIAVADISLWEIALLLATGILRAHGTVENVVNEFVTNSGALVQPITPEIAALATQFPDSYPRDPADRLIGATARANGLALVTRDERMHASPLLKTIW
ncbi:MAG TPA: type II toxin-antitoxin system VapC family toxin [Terriglobales bacterium]